MKSTTGDPRDPASTRGSFLLRIADGLKDGSVSIAKAEKELQKLERADLEKNLGDKKLELAEKIKKVTALGSLPAKQKALAIAAAKRAGVSRERLSDIAKNNADMFKTYIDGLANLQKEGVLGEFSEGIVNRAVTSAKSSKRNPEAGQSIGNELDNLDLDVKKEFTMQAYQKLIAAAAAGQRMTLDQAIDLTIRDFNNAGRLGKRSLIGITTTPGSPIGG